MSRDEWATPDDFFAACVKRWGTFHLDAAASIENTRANHWITKEDDGLVASWRREGRIRTVWCNPPWGRHNIDWVRKAASERHHGVTTTMLLPCATSTEWFSELLKLADKIYFLKGRVQFVPPSGIKASSNDRDQVIARFLSPYKILRLGTGDQMQLWDWKKAKKNTA